MKKFTREKRSTQSQKIASDFHSVQLRGFSLEKQIIAEMIINTDFLINRNKPLCNNSKNTN